MVPPNRDATKLRCLLKEWLVEARLANFRKREIYRGVTEIVAICNREGAGAACSHAALWTRLLREANRAL